MSTLLPQQSAMLIVQLDNSFDIEVRLADMGIRALVVSSLGVSALGSSCLDLCILHLPVAWSRVALGRSAVSLVLIGMVRPSSTVVLEAVILGRALWHKQAASLTGCDCEHGSHSLCDAVLEFYCVQVVAASARLEKLTRASSGGLRTTRIAGR